MIKVNFKDSSTLEFNLQKEDDYNQWLEWSSVDDFQDNITGIGIVFEKRLMMMPLPKRFRSIRFSAELVYRNKKGNRELMGERILCHVDNVLIDFTVNNACPKTRIVSSLNIKKIGKQMFKNFKYKGIKDVGQ